jgi:IPT/TIG domain
MRAPRFLASTLTMACLMALQATAQAAVDPTVIPLNSQIGSLRLPLQCTFPVIGTQTLTIKLTGSMATTVTPGQPFYMTDGSGTLEFPQALVDLSYTLLGARSGSGSITELNFDIAKATPSTINALATPIVVENLAFTKGSPVKMALPAQGFLQVGPMVAQNADGQVLVKMGTAKGVLTLKTASGKTILWPLGVNCKAPSPAVVVLGMTISGAHTDEVSAPHTNIRTEDLDTPMNTQTGSLRFPLSCNVQGLGRRDVDGTFNGVAPVLYAPGEVFYAGKGYGRIVLPAGVVNELLDQVPAATKASTYVDLLEFSSTNTAPVKVDMAAGGKIAGSDVNIVRGQDVVTRFPASTDIAIGPFKAQATGTDTAMYVGRTGAVVQLKNAGGQLLDTRRVDCDVPNPPTTIVSVTIAGAAVVPATVTSVSPTSTVVAGGKTITIYGTNFSNARAVTFGGIAATSFTVSSATKITAVTPALPAGTLEVKVQGMGGTTKTGTIIVK